MTTVGIATRSSSISITVTITGIIIISPPIVTMCIIIVCTVDHPTNEPSHDISPYDIEVNKNLLKNNFLVKEKCEAIFLSDIKKNIHLKLYD